MPIPPQDPAPFAAAPLADTVRAAAARDAGVRRVRRTTRWLLVGAVGLTGAIAGVAAQQTLPSGSTANAAAATDDGGAAYNDDGRYAVVPQAPAQAPQSASSSVAPSVSSGAS